MATDDAPDGLMWSLPRWQDGEGSFDGQQHDCNGLISRLKGSQHAGVVADVREDRVVAF
jgi:hypothetical protein